MEGNGGLVIVIVWHSLKKNKVGGSGLETMENGANDDERNTHGSRTWEDNEESRKAK